MGSFKPVVTVLRSFALVGAVTILAMSVWTLVVVQAIDKRGVAALSPFRSELGFEARSWTRYITAATRGKASAWALVVLSSTTALINLLVIMSNRYYWLRMPTVVIVLMELTAVVLSIAAFGSALSFALSLEAYANPSLSTLDSAELTFFTLPIPLSRALTVTSALVSVLLIATLTATLVHLHNRRKQAKDTRAFEPTVSALGMSHGFHALHPQPKTPREHIPTMYDPYRAFRKGPGAMQDTRQITFTDEGRWISRKHTNSRWSASTSSPRGVERDIVKLLDIKKARRAVPVRPVRPWSGMWDERERNVQG